MHASPFLAGRSPFLGLFDFVSSVETKWDEARPAHFGGDICFAQSVDPNLIVNHPTDTYDSV